MRFSHPGKAECLMAAGSAAASVLQSEELIAIADRGVTWTDAPRAFGRIGHKDLFIFWVSAMANTVESNIFVGNPGRIPAIPAREGNAQIRQGKHQLFEVCPDAVEDVVRDHGRPVSMVRVSHCLQATAELLRWSEPATAIGRAR